jgi:peptide/nickel transport system permease protein/oligopeptide transport system permease protein
MGDGAEVFVDEVAPPPALAAGRQYGLKKNKLALAGLVWIIIVILVAVTADLWAPYWRGDPVDIDSATVTERTLRSPSWEHPFGTDKLGRDVASRVIYGARVSLIVGVLAVAIMVIIGLVMGAFAAYYGGIWSHYHANGRRLLRFSLHPVRHRPDRAYWGRAFIMCSSPLAFWGGRA